MSEELTRNYRRWLAAEHDGRDDEADAACMALFRDSVSHDPVSPRFATETMELIVAARARDARRARVARRLLVWSAAALVVTAFAFRGGAVVSAVFSVFVVLFNVLISAIVWIATRLAAGADVWSVLSSIGKAAAGLLADPTVTVALFAIQGIAIGALVMLQRLLGSNGETLE
jgi:hypothetical protein